MAATEADNARGDASWASTEPCRETRNASSVSAADPCALPRKAKPSETYRRSSRWHRWPKCAYYIVRCDVPNIGKCAERQVERLAKQGGPLNIALFGQQAACMTPPCRDVDRAARVATGSRVGSRGVVIGKNRGHGVQPISCQACVPVPALARWRPVCGRVGKCNKQHGLSSAATG